ncbi:unnamed protein product [Phaedon cochleariae]|uniref:SWIM-type domain-containing protein n=1 Tax=Phaedon cochleariae TaxID=80249 RepID=A0A9P0GLI2_PHACE|nr:unnamed protein product [Phaedon cochleariae]
METPWNPSRQMSRPFSNISLDTDKFTQRLSGLGKPTKRGIKKCSKCGIYNGTRSTVCKNKRCNVILKDVQEKSNVDLEAVKLLTGTEKQVFSVKVMDIGPNYRGFVQLPVFHSYPEEDPNILSDVALCFVNSCQNLFDNSILRCHEEDQSKGKLLCNHIKSALRSRSTARLMELKNDVLHAMHISEEIKSELYLLASEKKGALVQRVSNSVMAVKCQVSSKHPLGYLHFTFVKEKAKDFFGKYYCSCTHFLDLDKSLEGSRQTKQKCHHYYACIWALMSENEQDEEFSYFRRHEVSCNISDSPSLKNSRYDFLLANADQFTSKGNLHINQTESIPSSYTSKSLRGINIKNRKKIKRDKSLKKRELFRKCRSILPNVLPIEIQVLNNPATIEEKYSWGFMDWLSYVTECINKTMQFDNYGIVNSLGFQIPENFYQCFKNRIPSIYEPTQLGYSFVYNVMNILHLKEIFDTSQMKLRISKKFVHDEQNGYVEYDEAQDEGEERVDSFHYPFIFFFNVGESTVDESDNMNNSFYIEWTPSITSVTNIGQLKFQYKYGRKGT